MAETPKRPYEDPAQYWLHQRRALVPQSVLPENLRLAVVLPRLDVISSRVAAEETNRAQSQPIIDAAERYIPPFALEIIMQLAEPMRMLAEAGVDFKELDAIKTLKEVSRRTFETRDHSQRPNQPIARGFGEEAKARRREIQTLLHPDKGNRIVEEAVDPRQRVALFSETTEAEEEHAENADIVHINYVRTMPAYLFETIAKGLAEGQTLEQILEQNSGLLQKANDAIYLSQVYLPLSGFDKAFLNPEAAEREAEKTRREKDLHSHTHAFSIIITTFAGLSSYIHTGEIDTNIARSLSFAASALVDVGGDLGGITDAKERRVISYENGTARFRMNQAEDRIRAMAREIGALVEALIKGDSDTGSAPLLLSNVTMEANAALRALKSYLEALFPPQQTYYGQRSSPRGSDFGYRSKNSDSNIIRSSDFFKNNKKNSNQNY